MSWSRRGLLTGLGALPALACSDTEGARSTRRPGPRRSVKLRPLSRRNLDGGALLYHAAEPGLPLVSLAVVVPAGYVDEPPERAGQASLIASMLRMADEDLAHRFGDLGASLSVSPGPRALAVHTTVLRDDARPALELLLETLRDPPFSSANLERARRKRHGSLSRLQGDTEALARLGVLRGLYGVEPVVPIVGDGTRASVDALELEELRRWFAGRLKTGAMSLAITGAVEIDEAQAWAEAACAGLERGEVRDFPSKPRTGESRPAVVFVEQAGAQRSVLAFGTPTVGNFAAEAPARDLAAGVLRGLLHLDLRERGRLAYGVSGKRERTRFGPVELTSAKVRGKDLARAIDRTRELLQVLAKKPQVRRAIAEQALPELRGQHLTSLVHDVHGADALRARLVRFARVRAPADTDHQRLARLQSMEPGELADALAQLCDPQEIRLCVAGPRDSLEAARAVLPGDGALCRPADLLGLASPSKSKLPPPPSRPAIPTKPTSS